MSYKKCGKIINKNDVLCKEDCDLCFNKSMVSHEQYKNWSDKNCILPRNVLKSSKTKYIFNCDNLECLHEYMKAPTNICFNKQGCPYCVDNYKRQLCKDNNCLKCYQHSFASCENSKYWSELNDITPRECTKNSGKKFKFKCPVCFHHFENRITDINKEKYTNGKLPCGFCKKGGNLLCDELNCKMCFDNSFASSKRKNNWSDKNKIKPRFVYIGSIKKYLFNCDDCNHEFETSPQNIKKGSWCGYCNNDLLCNDVNCNWCNEKSFILHPKAQYWSKNNKKTARQTRKNSHDMILFDCNNCKHEFEIRLEAVTRGQWC